MNGFTIPSTSVRVIAIVVTAIALDAFIGITTLSVCLVMGIKPDPTLITAYVGITGGLVGALTGLLANTRTTPGSDADMPKATLPTADKPTL
jgi:hypothetical protein